MQEQKLTRNLS